MRLHPTTSLKFPHLGLLHSPTSTVCITAASSTALISCFCSRNCSRIHPKPSFNIHIQPYSRTMSTSSTTSSTPPSPAWVLKQPVKLACVQFAATPSKSTNLATASSLVRRAASAGARIVVLPECFNSPYGCNHFPDYAEPLPRPDANAAPWSKQAAARDDMRALSYRVLANLAALNGIYLIGGSVPERDEATGKLFNTCLVFGPDGRLLDAVRKLHLFDIDIPGKMTFRESDVLSPGNRIALIRLPEYGTLAVAICYDVRFPEIATVAARSGAFALVYPGAFNLVTGPLHWELLARARAVDNQLYVVMCSPARDMTASYHAWGHSMIVDPMAKVVAEAGEGEAIIEHQLDGAVIDEARRNIPLNSQRRFDVYPNISKGRIRFKD